MQVDEKLAAYPHPLADDYARLKAGPGARHLPPFSNARHAVVQVSGEKEVLHHFRDLCAVALDLIDHVDPSDDAVRAWHRRPSFETSP